jgi:hypothetical protein
VRTLFLVPLALALCTGLGVPARAEDAAKIVDQYIKAAGGAQRISKLPNRYYSELVAGDQSWIEAYNGKSAWHQNGVGEVATSLGQESSQLEAAGNYYNARLVNSKRTSWRLRWWGTRRFARETRSK